MGNRNYYKLKPPPLFQEKSKERKCLKCSEVFLSENGLRICPTCSEENGRCARRVDVSGGGTQATRKSLGD